LNHGGAAQRLRESAEPVDFGLFRSVSRDLSIYFGSSISGMTVEIDPHDPGRFTCAWAALPVRSVGFPLPMGQSSTPRCLVDGVAYKLGRESPRQDSRWEAMEQSMHAEKERLKEGLAASIDAGNPKAVHVEAMDQWSSDQARKIVRALALLE
ncbi:MAG: hypothetical protein U1E05_24415, partial [Patescibacteria group bacterium]|nr:hypothetical protein [Patescibacteria group bacterium]